MRELRSAIALLKARGLRASAQWAAELLVAHGDAMITEADPPAPVAGATRAPFLGPRAGVSVPPLAMHQSDLDPSDVATLAVCFLEAGEFERAAFTLERAHGGPPSALSRPRIDGGGFREPCTVDCCASPADVPILPTDHWAAHLFAAHVLRETGRAAASLASLVHVVGPEEPTPPRAAAHAAAPTDRRPPPAVRTAIAVSRPFRRETALALYALRRLAPARALLASLHADDPFDMSVVAPLSDCLFVTGRRADLASLAQRVHAAAKFRPEACLVMANHASARGDHERSILHLKRALRADPASATAWTLLGHEFLEGKNGPAAVEAYRRAIDVAPLDHRAWYGLGQAHELFGLRLRALDAFRRAAAVRPADGRMWTAMAASLDALGQEAEADACYRRAAACPESDGHAAAALAERGGAASGWPQAHRLAFDAPGIGGPPEGDAEVMRRADQLMEFGEAALQAGMAEDACAHAEAAVAILGAGGASGGQRGQAAAAARSEALGLLARAAEAAGLSLRGAPSRALAASAASGRGWAGVSLGDSASSIDLSSPGAEAERAGAAADGVAGAGAAGLRASAAALARAGDAVAGWGRGEDRDDAGQEEEQEEEEEEAASEDEAMSLDDSHSD
ncbi:hypothetical protein FNF31_01422 [Cafeteria roenbergensis]|uniref:Uncharacterized protein n=2 Tax=Cafeteria roenbergensis TaxID=33653 RepID=A0A5A8DLC8_CAFRO|nr:hypothetical protein FNF31_01422 [Cafeteria roenbergensis]